MQRHGTVHRLKNISSPNLKFCPLNHLEDTLLGETTLVRCPQRRFGHSSRNCKSLSVQVKTGLSGTDPAGLCEGEPGYLCQLCLQDKRFKATCTPITRGLVTSVSVLKYPQNKCRLIMNMEVSLNTGMGIISRTCYLKKKARHSRANKVGCHVVKTYRGLVEVEHSASATSELSLATLFQRAQTEGRKSSSAAEKPGNPPAMWSRFTPPVISRVDAMCP